MVDDFNSWLLAVGDDIEIADIAMEASDVAPLIRCWKCGRESVIEMTAADPAQLCACGAVVVEIVARL